jgi:hypothetical protein
LWSLRSCLVSPEIPGPATAKPLQIPAHPEISIGLVVGHSGLIGCGCDSLTRPAARGGRSAWDVEFSPPACRRHRGGAPTCKVGPIPHDRTDDKPRGFCRQGAVIDPGILLG